MARGYLSRVAERALPDRQPLRPPRHVTSALPLAAPEAPRPIAPSATALPVVAAPTAPEIAPPALVPPAPPSASTTATSASRADAVPDAAAVPAPVPAPTTRHVVRPAADFVFETPARMSPGRRPAAESERATTTSAMPGAAIPETAASPRLRSSVVPPVDPIATALAAALRWTSSPEPSSGQTTTGAVGGTNVAQPAVQPARPNVSRAGSERGKMKRETRPRAVLASTTRAQEGVPRPPSRAELSPTQVVAREAAPAARPSTSRQSTTTERSSGVHIGSVEVHILPPPEAKPAPPTTPHGTEAVPKVSRLARDLTSAIGLRQS